MSNASAIAVRTSIEAVNNGGAFRVYTTDVYGGIRETGYNGSGSWFGGDKAITTGKITTPISVANTVGLKNSRLYYISKDFKLSELCYDESDSGKGWFDGELSGKNYTVAPYSQIGAVYLQPDDEKWIRIYVQSPDNTIQEYGVDSDGQGWKKFTNLGPALPGTSIAVVSYAIGSKTAIRVYHQATNGDLIEKAHDTGSSWQTGSFAVKSAIPRAAIAATAWKTASSGTGIRVYYTGANDVILEKGNDGSWYDGAFKQPSLPGSQIGVLSWLADNTKEPEIRVYFQNGTEVTGVSEWKWQGGLGAWAKGIEALPPAAQ